jgi:DNA-binding transcriptional ArsR family regulator
LGATSSKQTARPIDEAVPYNLGHWIRVEALSILNDGPASPSEIARMIGSTVSKVGNHIKALLDNESIEFVRVETARNANEHFYRAIERPFLTDEETRALPTKVRHKITGIIIQGILAEVLSAFRAKKMDHDDDIWMSWRSFNLDAQGRREVADEKAESYERVVEIAARAADRLAESGETGTSVVVAMMSFIRSRTGRRRGRRLSAEIAE